MSSIYALPTVQNRHWRAFLFFDKRQFDEFLHKAKQHLQRETYCHLLNWIGATQTKKTNQKAELKQQIPTFSNPAHETLRTKQRNLNLFVGR